MKVFIPSLGRPDLPTLDLACVPGLKPTVLVHTPKEAAAYVQSGVPERGGDVVVTGVPTGPGGKSRQMHWALHNMGVKRGEWVAFLDDDLKSVREIRPKLRPDYGDTLGIDLEADDRAERVRYWRAAMRDVPTAAALLATWRMCIQNWAEAEGVHDHTHGVHMVGFSSNSNPAFNNTPLTGPVVWVKGHMFLWKHDPTYPWEACFDVQVDDYWHTAQHILRYGAVVRYNWLWPDHGMYIPGGHGTMDERRDQRHADILRLEKDFPGFFKPKNTRGAEPGFDVRVAIRGERSVARWRAAMADRQQQQQQQRRVVRRRRRVARRVRS